MKKTTGSYIISIVCTVLAFLFTHQIKDSDLRSFAFAMIMMVWGVMRHSAVLYDDKD